MKATFPGVKMMVSGGVARCFHRPMGDGRMTLLDMAPDFGSKSPVAKDKVQKQKVQNAAVVLANQDIAANHLLVQQDLVTLAGRVAVTLLNQRAVVVSPGTVVQQVGVQSGVPVKGGSHDAGTFVKIRRFYFLIAQHTKLPFGEKSEQKKSKVLKPYSFAFGLFANVWQESKMTCAFYSNSQLSLMTSAGTGYAAWNNLCSVRQVSLQSWNIFVIDVFDFIHAERTNFFSAFSVASVISFGSFSFHET